MKNLKFYFLALTSIFIFACGSDDDMFSVETETFNYTIHNGQTVPAAPYGGIHPNDVTASMTLESLENGNTMVTITLENTISGATYHMHAHDAADASSTPNGTPYDETPNSNIFAQALLGTGGQASVSQEAKISFSDLINDYSGFFVIHDPLQGLSTVDITSYLVVGSFARVQNNPTLKSSTFSYDFNTGQLVPSFAYSGSHSTDLKATIQVDELADSRSRVTVRIMNSLEGETYHSHAHDMADAATTPNGTPYIEAPNVGVFAASILGNGATAGAAVISETSFDSITTSYDGFFVVHDPLQTLTTVDPTTYIILGVFAR